MVTLIARQASHNKNSVCANLDYYSNLQAVENDGTELICESSVRTGIQSEITIRLSFHY